MQSQHRKPLHAWCRCAFGTDGTLAIGLASMVITLIILPHYAIGCFTPFWCAFHSACAPPSAHHAILPLHTHPHLTAG